MVTGEPAGGTPDRDDGAREVGADDVGTADDGLPTGSPAKDETDDGGDVAGRDPDAIAAEIEQTRAELAETIDAIADRISPKRAASRGAQAVKAQVSSARSRLEGEPGPRSDPGPGLAAGPPGGAASPLAAVTPKVAAAGVALVVVLWLIRRRRR
jgi:hypothetical protein